MKIAVVTGAGRREGLGFEVARQLAAQGFRVFLTARRIEQAEPLARELLEEGLDVAALPLDTTDADSVDRAVAHITDTHGKVDVLVNNAAIMGFTPVEDNKADLRAVQRDFDANVIGTWRVAQEFYPLLRASGDGRIVNVSSGAGSFWDPDYGLVNNPGLELGKFSDVSMIGSYALTKLAVNGLTIKLSKDFQDAGILVNAACPGVVSTRPGAPGRPVADGARSIVWAATLPSNGPTGLFFRDGKQLPW